MTEASMAWGGPLHGQMFPNQSDRVLSAEPAEPVQWDHYLGPVVPGGYRQVVYRAEKVGLTVDGYRSADHCPQVEAWHHGLERPPRTTFTARCWLRPNDGESRTQILGGLRLIHWIASGTP